MSKYIMLVGGAIIVRGVVSTPMLSTYVLYDYEPYFQLT